MTLPRQQRETRIVKDMPAEEIAREIVAWIGGQVTPAKTNMEKILFLAHTEPDGTVAKAALETLPAAQSLGGGELDSRLVGDLTQTAADQLAACGATRFLAVEGDPFAESRYATDAAAAEALCRARRRH